MNKMRRLIAAYGPTSLNDVDFGSFWEQPAIIYVMAAAYPEDLR